MQRKAKAYSWITLLYEWDRFFIKARLILLTLVNEARHAHRPPFREAPASHKIRCRGTALYERVYGLSYRSVLWTRVTELDTHLAPNFCFPFKIFLRVHATMMLHK